MGEKTDNLEYESQVHPIFALSGRINHVDASSVKGLSVSPHCLTRARSWLAFRAGQQSFTLGQLAGGLAVASYCFALFAGPLFRRLFVGTPCLHFAKHAFALQLLLQDP